MAKTRSSAEHGDESEARHPIGVVSRRTGLTQDLIRAWERRYAAVEPARTPTNRRFYTDGDVERLNLLQQAIDGGRSIGQVAELSDRELSALVTEDRRAEAAVAEDSAAEEAPLDEAVEEVLREAMAAVRALDARALDARLDAAAVDLGRTVLIERVLAPLMHRVGDRWMAGELRPVHEHMTTAAVRSLLGALQHSEPEPPPSAPLLVATTPSHQVHEVGALLVTATALSMGWRATYLGPNLPAEEIATAARDTGARAVALSITYPPDDPRLADELARLVQLLAGEPPLLVGGKSAGGYTEQLEEGAILVGGDLAALRAHLGRLRG